MTQAAPTPDFTAARNFMVDGQLRPTKVTDRRVLDAMRSLPREAFVPDALAPLAYIDEELNLGEGRVMLRPLVLARLLQLANPQPGENMLIVGAGTGYGAAVAACTGAQLVALEEAPKLLARARATQAALGYGATIVAGPLGAGAAEYGPFDVILIEGAVREIPGTLSAQLAKDGRVIAVIAPADGAPYAVQAEPAAGGLAVRPVFDANASLLTPLLPAPVFAF